MTRYRVGCTSWSYPDWVGPFYPGGTPSAEFLQRYSRAFSLVEADATFYRIPRPEVTERWAADTPEGFTFTAKFSRRITHEAGLAAVEEPTRFFLERMEPLRKAGKLGPLLAQFPPSFRAAGKNMALLGPFLDLVPSSQRVAVEFRHTSWFTEATYKVLRDHGASLVWQVTHEEPSPAVLTADFLYARLIGPDRVFEKFDRVQRDLTPQMRALRERLEDEGREAKDVFVLCSNHFQGHGPGTAMLMSEALGLPRPDLGAAKRGAKQRNLADFA